MDVIPGVGSSGCSLHGLPASHRIQESEVPGIGKQKGAALLQLGRPRDIWIMACDLLLDRREEIPRDSTRFYVKLFIACFRSRVFVP